MPPADAPPAVVEAVEPRRLLSGDTIPGINAVFPATAFMHVDPSARLIDVTKLSQIDAIDGPDATPNDSHDDDSRAFVAALDFIKAQQVADAGTENSPTRSPDTSYVLYVPEGVFHVEDTIEYSGAPYDFWVQMRIIGQSRDGSIIRLKDDQAGFGASTRKAVIDFSQRTGDDPDARGLNNWPAQNVLRHLTVDVGDDNPGAVGVDFFGANNAEIHDVSIISGDGQGEIGLHLPIGIASGYFHDVTIDGFDRGVLMHPYHFADPAIENITLRNQNDVGIRVVNSTPSIRSLYSDNSVPALDLTDGGAHVVLIDSKLVGGASDVPAIRLDDTGTDRDAEPVAFQDRGGPSSGIEVGHLFARDVRIDGYASAVEKDGVVAVEGTFIDEYVSDASIGFDADQRVRSMHLPVKATPQKLWTSVMSQWSSPNDFGAVGDGVTDDTAAVQAAFSDPATRIVFFPSAQYRITSTIDIPAHVDRVHGMFTSLSGRPGGSYFKIAQNEATPLVVDDFYSVVDARMVDHAEPRTLVLDTIRSTNLYSNTDDAPQRGDLFVNNVNAYGKTEASRAVDQNVYARFINTEYKGGANFLVGDGGVMWVLGYKVEGGTINFDVEAGGALEVLGGTANQFGQSTFDDGASQDIVVTSNDGNLSVILNSNGPNSGNFLGFETVLVDNQNGNTSTVLHSDLPDRQGRLNEWLIPLYVSYDLDDLPAASAELAHYPFDGNLTSSTAPDAVGNNGYAAGKFVHAAAFTSGEAVDLPSEIVEQMSSAEGSVSLWVKTQQSSIGMILHATETGGNGFGGQKEMHLHTDGDDIGFFLEGSGLGDRKLAGSDDDGDVTDGQWHHVAATWAASGQVRLYVDGVLRAAKQHNGNLFGFEGGMKLGKPTSSTRHFDGSIDDLRLFDRALSSSEISDLYSKVPIIADTTTSGGTTPGSFVVGGPRVLRSLFAVDDESTTGFGK